MIRTFVNIVAIAVLVAVLGADAQQLPTPYNPAFHSAPSNATTFQFELGDSVYTSPSIMHQLVYRDSNATSWTRATMSLLYQTCTTYTYSGAISYVPPSGPMEYYFRSENDTAAVSMSPKNSANTFPVPAYLMADMGADSSGDAIGAAGPFLDLTGMQMGYSDTKIYARITNVSGGFPLSQGFTTFFLYGVGIISPDETDSVGYAMVNVNVLGLMTPGLYKVNPVDTSFTKIGNITTNITGNALSMSCNIADLTAQPGWGAWPPPSGFIMTAPMTATQTTSGFTTNDVGKGGVFLPSSHFLRFGLPNSIPTLTSAQVTLSGANSISAQIVYTDANNDLPVLRELFFGAGNRGMKACEKRYQNGATFADSFAVTSSGWYQYYFRFSDGKDTVTTPTDSIQIMLPVRGDADGSGSIDVSDVVYLISYIFAGGPAPNPLMTGDANCDSSVDISDAVFLISYIFSGGPAPCS